MLMSQDARSFGAIGCPSLGASAALATLTPRVRARLTASFSSIDMAHLALGIDAPARDGVAVLHCERGHMRTRRKRPRCRHAAQQLDELATRLCPRRLR